MQTKNCLKLYQREIKIKELVNWSKRKAREGCKEKDKQKQIKNQKEMEKEVYTYRQVQNHKILHL